MHTNPLIRFANAVDALNEGVGRTISWLTLGLVVVVFLAAALRYLFGLGSIALQESAVYLHALVFMLGLAYALKRDAHVRVDLLYRPMGRRAKAWVDGLGALFLLLPTSVFILVIGWEYVAASWAIREGSRQAGGIDGVWLLKSVILAAFILVVLQGLSQAARSFAFLLGGEGNDG